MVLKLRLDTETADQLCAMALRDLRPVDLQAVVLLRRGLGLPVPYPSATHEPEGMAHDAVKV
jgi:hypothetical protein